MSIHDKFKEIHPFRIKLILQSCYQWERYDPNVFYLNEIVFDNRDPKTHITNFLLDKKVIDEKTVDKKPVNNQIVDKKITDDQIVDKKIINNETVNNQTIDKDFIDLLSLILKFDEIIINSTKRIIMVEGDKIICIRNANSTCLKQQFRIDINGVLSKNFKWSVLDYFDI